jgi:hypothetical protein
MCPNMASSRQVKKKSKENKKIRKKTDKWMNPNYVPQIWPTPGKFKKNRKKTKKIERKQING